MPGSAGFRIFRLRASGSCFCCSAVLAGWVLWDLETEFLCELLKEFSRSLLPKVKFSVMKNGFM